MPVPISKGFIMRNVFSIDNPVFNAISRIGDMFLLSLLWVITSIPIITIGASTTALFDVCIKILRARDHSIVKQYLLSFRDNFKQATIIWLILLPVGVALFFDIIICLGQHDILTLVVLGVSMGLAFLYTGLVLFVFAVQAVFENKVKDTIRTAFLMMTRHLFKTLIIVVFTLGIAYLCFLYPIVLFFVIFIGIGALGLIYSVQFITVFRKYNPELMPDETEGKPEPILQKTNRHDEKRKAVKVNLKGDKIIK